MTALLNLWTATDILQDARDGLKRAENRGITLAGIRTAQIRLDMLMIGYEAVERKIKAGHPYGTVGCLLGGE